MSRPHGSPRRADEAIEQYEKALKLDPASAAAHYNLGGALVRRGEPAVAERHFRAALERKPSAPAFAGLGLALYHQGRVGEAIASLQAGIAADPKHPAAYEQLGVILTEQGKLEGRLEEVEKEMARTRASGAR